MQPTPEYSVLEYTLADDYLERRAALRADHLALARAAHERGELLLAGALPDPYDRALLVWIAPREVVERFVEQDPYVVQGLVTGWTVRPWNVAVGGSSGAA
ncbi:YciI-like protein [Geodermatophilus sp. YIM 151500]|uniref:YciI-like protein n=1 Tax=Geodermatophilus sp. YIM 151500 TaxID=2984531 RepID=UPI0021E4C2E9|nr:YciI-like protein [Geodermatophilus sp. YIM 151500]MCV2487783.1 YciI-like protein [Geodermatophilus sp. YIM 151500]